MIGIFDSGLGGLTVVKEVFKQLPEHQVVYFGDTARYPYGAKSKETIKKYAQENTEFLISKGAKVIVIACNTASAAATDYLKEKSNLPIFEVITTAVKEAKNLTKNRRIGVIGTRATINSGIYEKSLNGKNKKFHIIAKACPLFVHLVEENWVKKPETKTIAKKYLQSLKVSNIDTLILGCTHYPLLKDVIQAKIGRRVKIVDSASATAAALKEYLGQNPKVADTLTKGKDHQIYVSDITPQRQQLAQQWLARPVKLELAQVG